MMTYRLKKPYLIHDIIIVAGVMVCSILSSSAADRYTVSSGDWSNPLIWAATPGGAPGAGVPGKNDDVYIENGHSVTVISSSDCSSITFTGQSATLTVNSPATLTLKNGISLNKLTSSNSECFLTGTGILICTEVIVGTSANPPPSDPMPSLYTHTFNTEISYLDLTVKGSPKNNITINSYVGSFNHVRNGVFNLENGIVTVDGKITTNNPDAVNSSVFSMSAGSESGILYLNAKPSPFDLSPIGTSIIDLNGSASMVNYSYSGNQTVLATDYNNVTLSESGVKTVSGITVNGTLSMEGTTTAAGTAPVYGLNSALQYKGSAAQITGIEFPADFTGTGGIIIDNNNGVTLDNDRLIESKLTFINGKIVTGSYTLTMNSNAVIEGAGEGKYIFGSLQKILAPGTLSNDFEIGDASIYAPVNLAFTGTIGAGGGITARTTSGDHPNIGSSTFNAGVTVNRFWTLSNSGVTGFISYSANFNFAAADIDAGADYNNFYAGNYNAMTWFYPSTGILSPTSTQVNGLTTFGDFQVGELPIASFRSRQTGDWDLVSTWESFDGTAWIPAASTPNSAAGYIIIRDSHIVTISTPVTVDQVIIDPGGRLNANSDITINDGPSLDISVEGILDCEENIISGTGSFILNISGELIISSPDGISESSPAGNIQTSSRTYSDYGNYTYRGTVLQITGDGLPAIVNNLTVDNPNGVTLTNPVSINGTTILSAGPLIIGSQSITFLGSDIPISRTSGTITTDAGTVISFGTPADPAGAAFALPAGTFTGSTEINNLNIYRTNGITLNEQMLNVNGIVFCNSLLETNGNLTLLSSPAGTALIDGSTTGDVTGSVTMQRYLPSAYGYKYISSPVRSATINELSDDIDLGASFPTLFSYDESRTTSGWVDYITPDLPMNPLAGFAANFGSSAVPFVSDISGEVNDGALSATLYNHNNPYTLGFNLVGNPYPSPIDWDSPAGWIKTNIDDALYFFKASTTDEYGGTYSTYINKISSDGEATNIVPSLQGFFVHVSDGSYPVTGTLGLDNNVRVSDFTHQFLKSSKKGLLPMIRLNAAYADNLTSPDPLVIYFDEKATIGFDSRLDALKLLNTDYDVPSVYTISGEGAKLSINALPEFSDPLCRIPLGINLDRDGYIVFRIDKPEAESYERDISITDRGSGKVASLINNKGYQVFLQSGEHNDRFFLNISSFTTDVPEIVPEEELFSIYNSSGVLKVFIDDQLKGGLDFSIFNLTGVKLFGIKIFESGYHEFRPDLIDGIYIATITTGKHRIARKIVIRR